MNLSFIDTSVLVYAYDADAGDKHLKAQRLLRECWEKESGVISMQVLQEFYVTVTRRLPKTLPKANAREVVQTYHAWPVYTSTIEDIITASELEDHHKLSFWDALIVTSAQMSGAKSLISEDMQDGRQFGIVKVVNPFS